MSLALLVPLAVALSRIFYPFDSGFNESVTWEPARLIVSGQNPYELALTSRPPYTMSAYGPVYYTMLGIGIGCFGPQFWFGRCLSLLALLGSAACIYLLVARSIKDAPAKGQLCCLGVAIFLAQLPVAYWSGMQRPDFISLAFALYGLVLANVGIESRLTSRHAIFSALLFSAAVLCRQTTILPVALAVAWNWRSSRREALWLLGTFAGIIAFIYLILQVSSHGGFAELMWTLPSASARSMHAAVDYLTVQFITPVTTMVLLLALIAVLYGKSTSQQASESASPLRWWLLYFLGSSLLAFVTTSRIGANINYWLEPCAIGGILSALALARHDFSTRIRQIGFAVVLISSWVSGMLMLRDEQMRWHNLPYLREVRMALQKYVPPGEPVAARYVDWVILAGRTPWFNDTFQYKYSPEYRGIYENVVKSRKLGALLQPGPVPPGYRRIIIGNRETSLGINLDVREDLYKAGQP